MAKSLSALKKKRKNSLKSIQDQVKKEQSTGAGADDRKWKPTPNAEGYAYATIRFLPPAPDGEFGEETERWVKYFYHSFKHNGKWYWENCRTSIPDGEDPVADFNNHLWNNIGTEKSQNQARDQKRKKTFVANVYVIRDAGNPDNEGKVFLYEFGDKIFDKIEGAICPPKDSGREGMDVFDPWDGANFLIEGKPNTFKANGQDKKFLDYAESRFDAPSPLLDGDDDAIDGVWKQQHPLNEFTEKNEKFFKSYDELQAKLENVMGGRTMAELLDADYKPSEAKKDAVEELEDAVNTDSMADFLSDDDEDTDDIPSFAKETSVKSNTKKSKKSEKVEEEEDDSGDLDDDLQDLADIDDLDDLDDI